LDGFPLKLKHYKELVNNNISPSHIINLVLSDDKSVYTRNEGLHEDLYYPAIKIFKPEE